MRVTHVITRLIVGGAQENTIATVLGVAAKTGWQSELISGPTTGPEGSLEGAFASHPGLLTVLPELVRPVHPWNDWLALRQLERVFRERRPDVVHTHSGKAGIVGRSAARRAGVPVIIHSIHGPSFGSFQGGLANFVFATAERAAGRVTTHFVAVADAMIQQYLSAGIGRRDQYTRVFSGFDLAPYRSARNDLTLRARFGFEPEDFIVGKIARLFQLKGHDDLIAAAPAVVREFPRTKFLLVGDGPWRQRLGNEIRRLGLERHFVFTGLVRPDEVPALLGIMDAVAHLSRREGLARALPQALAAAKPVVAFDCDGAGEVCLDSRTGFLIRPGDITTLQERLLRLARDPVLRTQLGRAGREFVCERFSSGQMVDELIDLYGRLVRESRLHRK